jgi:Fe-S-cluster containining protein
MEGPWGSPPAYEPPSAETRVALAEVYRRVDAALAPVAAATCRACGKCCRFEPGGIILFASVLELAYLLAETPVVRAPGVISGSRDSWRCPYQRENLCTARGARLLGCRTYFCDAEAREAGEGAYAEALREIQRIAEGQGPWWYGPARAYLEAVYGA